MHSCRRNGERGMTLILVALCMLVFIGMAALAVDVGVLYTARTSAQHAADAGALAGATTFLLQPTAPQPATAVDAAIRIANQNNVLGTAAGIAAGDVTVDAVNGRVTVTVPRTATRGNAIALYFGRIFGLTTSDIAASATAEATTPNGGHCIKPIYIPNTVLSPAGDATAACTATPPQVMFEYAGGQWQLSQWMKSQPNQGFGASVTLKSNPSGTLVPSQYYALDVGSGASTYQCVWSSCMSNPACNSSLSIVQCGTQYPVKTGNMTGPTIQGADGLICGPSGNCNTNPPDTWGGIGDYIPPGGGTPSTTSRSLALFPVWDNCANPIIQGTGGQQAQVIGFLEAFVDSSRADGSVVGHVVDPMGCHPPGAGTGPFTAPVRLVQAAAGP